MSSYKPTSREKSLAARWVERLTGLQLKGSNPKPALWGLRNLTGSKFQEYIYELQECTASQATLAADRLNEDLTLIEQPSKIMCRADTRPSLIFHSSNETPFTQKDLTDTLECVQVRRLMPPEVRIYAVKSDRHNYIFTIKNMPENEWCEKTGLEGKDVKVKEASLSDTEAPAETAAQIHEIPQRVDIVVPKTLFWKARGTKDTLPPSEEHRRG